MGRGGIRRARTHHMGKSNRQRILKLADAVAVKAEAPDLTFADPKSQIGRFKRSSKLVVAPEICRTRLGGTVLRPSSRVGASRYKEEIEEHVLEHATSSWMQPEWVNMQPLLGVSEWSPNEAPRALACFSVTDDVFE